MLSGEWLSRYGLLTRTGTGTHTGTGTWTTGVTAIALCTSCSRANDNAVYNLILCFTIIYENLRNKRNEVDIPIKSCIT